jgi:hypothetical protein
MIIFLLLQAGRRFPQPGTDADRAVYCPNK